MVEASWAGARRPGLRLERSALETVDLSSARVPDLRAVDCELVRCDLANLDARGASLFRVVVAGGRLTGTALTEGTLRDVAFRTCRADLTTFAGSTLERVAFDDCLLAQADFRGARLESVVFRDCDLSAADLTGARLRRVELRRCRLDGLVGVHALRGAAMPFEDMLAAAQTFAEGLGVRVLDAD